MSAPLPADVPETGASGAVAESFEAVRQALGSTFVPTVYRRLAAHPDALSAAVAALPTIVEAARSNGFAQEVTGVARSLVHPSWVPDAAAPPAASFVVARYRAANPLNLLFAVTVLGVESPIDRVMEPPLPERRADVDDDIRLCHGGSVLPGLWRELGAWAEWRYDAWNGIREDAAAGRLSAARAEVLAAALVLASSIRADDVRDEVASLLPEAAALELRWFPAVIASMVVEAEWLVRTMNPHTEE